MISRGYNVGSQRIDKKQKKNIFNKKKKMIIIPRERS